MKKIISTVLVLVLILSLTACFVEASSQKSEEERKIELNEAKKVNNTKEPNEENKKEKSVKQDTENVENTLLLEGKIIGYNTRIYGGVNGILLDEKMNIDGREVKQIYFHEDIITDLIPRKYMTYCLKEGTSLKEELRNKISVKIKIDSKSYEYESGYNITLAKAIEVLSLDGETNPVDKRKDEYPIEYYKAVFYTHAYYDNLPSGTDVKEHTYYKNTEIDGVGDYFKIAVDKILEEGLFIEKVGGTYKINDTNEKATEDDYNLNYEEFFNLKECIIENIFSIKELTDDETFLFAEGEFDLNKDGKNDAITLKLKYEDNGLISVNNSEIYNCFENPTNVYLVDLIKDDGFVEIAVLDEGPSADPYTTFYRYNGENLEQISGGFYTDITSEDSVHVYYGRVLTNGKGVFIAPLDIIEFVSPKIIKAYRTLKDNRFIYNPLDYSEALHKEYTADLDFNAFFKRQDASYYSSEEAYKALWISEDVVKFHKGEKIKINSIPNPINTLGWYETELENGTPINLNLFCRYGLQLEDGSTGELYFWIGD